MQAIVKTKPENGAELQEVDTPKIAPDQVLVKVRATSICGTDVHIYRWDAWANGRIGASHLPQIMGHEVAGEVVEVGNQVHRIKVGDYISAETHIYDPGDLTALVGQLNVGDHMRILGVDTNGAFAEYFAVPESVCWVNDPQMPPEIATIQEPVGNAVYAVLGEDHDIAGKSMVILGDGPTGVAAAGVARACGVTQIFLVGENPYNLDIGRKMGADHTLDANADLDRVAYVRDHTQGYGADIVVEMAGAPRALEEGLQMVRRGGRFSAFGVMSQSPLSLDYNNAIVFKGVQIHGISGRMIFDTWYRVRNLLNSGRLDVKPMITQLLPLAEFEKGFAAAQARPRNSVKVVMFPAADEMEQARKRMGM
ncbi:MAG: alcohol dehydrogenase catalytic domain-containing protein [Acidobacteriota bacterium]|jgi:threonine 3-dehydrogenase